MSTRLENISRTSVTFNLTREIAPLRRTYERVHTDKDGNTHRADKRVIIPDSVTLQKGGMSEPYPDTVVRAPEVAWRIARGLLRAHVEVDAVSAGDKSAPMPALVEPKAEASEDSNADSPRRRGDRRSA